MTTIQNLEKCVAAMEGIGEWAAVGFYEGLDLPWPRSYGLAYRRLLEHNGVRVPDGRYLIPFEPQPDARSRESHGYWTAVSTIVHHNHHSGLAIDGRLADQRKADFPQYAAEIDAVVADLRARLVHFGGYTHTNPDMRRVVNEGFLSIEAELDGALQATTAESDTTDEANLLRTLKDYAVGVRAFHTTVATALVEAAGAATGLRKERLSLIARSFAHGFLNPSRNFVEGLLAVNFTWMLDGCDSIGRFDQVLGPLFEADIHSGTLDLAFARDLLDELWESFERLNGWNLQIGGYTPDGRDGVNALTLECIEACLRNKLRRPNVAFRVTKQTPESALILTLRALGLGSGRPALYNDDLYVESLLNSDLGLTLEDAREIGFGGCTETMIAGLSNVGSLEGDINLAKALELALHDGADPQTRAQRGPHTGAFCAMETFDEFAWAVKRQIQYMTDDFVAKNREALTRRFHQGDPKLARTLFTRDCVKHRKSFEAGGARYNWAVVSYQGIANLIDSMAAIRLRVYEERSIGKRGLLDALRDNYTGHETIHRLLKSAPKFGNDIAAVDDLGRDVIGYAWDELRSHETPRGGRYLPSCILFTTYAGAGAAVGATPDGRSAHTPLVDSVGPSQGKDANGPTAMLTSVASLPLWKAVGTPVLNLRLQKEVLTSDDGLKAAAALVRAFFDQGGMQIQVSAVSREEMLDARVNPDAHRDLIVRIGGYSEYFVWLSPALQDSVIARTEY
ncbi:MAG TPA: pyruvate formate lyase family protein [Capsulimonadaceae bacterium]|jgi:formate C-acetyltransferase